MHAWRPSWAECDPIGMDAATIWNEAWRTARSSHRLTRQLMTLMKLVTTGHDKLQVWRRIQLMTERTINPCHVAISGKTPDLPDGESAEERGARSEERARGEPKAKCSEHSASRLSTASSTSKSEESSQVVKKPTPEEIRERLAKLKLGSEEKGASWVAHMGWHIFPIRNQGTREPVCSFADTGGDFFLFFGRLPEGEHIQCLLQGSVYEKRRRGAEFL